MQYMNGFELCEKIFATDINVRACFMSSGEVNREATKQLHAAIVQSNRNETLNIRLFSARVEGATTCIFFSGCQPLKSIN
jgi:hypothetical protein